PEGALFMRRVYCLMTCLMRDLNVPTAQGYWIERQTGYDRSVRSRHLQPELIVSSRLPVVNHRDAERVVPHPVDRRLADEYPRIADNRERLHRCALEFYVAGRAAFVVKQFAFRGAVPPVPDVEPEVSGHAVVGYGSAASDESERRIIDRK